MSKDEKKIKNALIVIASYSAFRMPLLKAFKSLNISTSCFDNRKTIILEKVIFGFSIVYPPLYKFAVNHINSRLLKQVEVLKPDLVLVSKGENILPAFVEKISKKTTIVNWFTDLFSDFKKIEEWIAAYPLFFTQDRTDIKIYRNKGHKNLYCIPYAGPIFENLPNNRPQDIVFIGSFSKQREYLFNYLQPLKIKIWGDKKWGGSKLKESYMGKWLSQQEVGQVLKTTKIVVNQHQNRVLNMRVYEATAAAALLITDSSPDLRYMFKVGKEIVLYKNPDDLLAKAEFYLKHDKLRNKIANAGYLKTRNYHNYVVRIHKMFSIIDKYVH